MDGNDVPHKCGNCVFYLRPKCPRMYEGDTELWRSQVACEIFKPMTDEEKRMFYQELSRAQATKPTKEKNESIRDTVSAIFLLVFFINAALSLIVFRTQEVWGVLLFLSEVFLNICFLMVVNWVAEDEKVINELRRQVEELKEKAKERK